MDLVKIKQLAWELMGERQPNPGREPGYIFYHGQRVAKIALTLRREIFPHRPEHDGAITVGGWFHDVGKGIEPHWETGALLTERMLAEYCPSPELEKIVAIVEGHTLRKQKPQPDYVKLVQDADILDHFGSQEIWLNFWHTAFKRENVEYAIEFFEAYYSRNIKKVRDLLNFPASVGYFDEKDNFVQLFFERFKSEAMGDLIKMRKD